MGCNAVHSCNAVPRLPVPTKCGLTLQAFCRFIVVWQNDTLTEQACAEAHSQEPGARFSGVCGHHYPTLLNGFAVEVSPARVARQQLRPAFS